MHVGAALLECEERRVEAGEPVGVGHVDRLWRVRRLLATLCDCAHKDLGRIPLTVRRRSAMPSRGAHDAPAGGTAFARTEAGFACQAIRSFVALAFGDV